MNMQREILDSLSALRSADADPDREDFKMAGPAIPEADRWTVPTDPWTAA